MLRLNHSPLATWGGISPRHSDLIIAKCVVICWVASMLVGCDLLSILLFPPINDIPFWGDERVALTSNCGDDPAQYFHDPVSI